MSDLQKLNDVKTYLRDLKFKLILDNRISIMKIKDLMKRIFIENT